LGSDPAVVFQHWGSGVRVDGDGMITGPARQRCGIADPARGVRPT
jgi:hypothetical protein